MDYPLPDLRDSAEQILDLSMRLKRADKKNADLVRDGLRYKKLRRLNVRQFSELYERNLAGENFDQMVDEMV